MDFIGRKKTITNTGRMEFSISSLFLLFISVRLFSGFFPFFKKKGNIASGLTFSIPFLFLDQY